MTWYYCRFSNFQWRVIAATEEPGGRISERTVATYTNQPEAVGLVMLLRARRAQPEIGEPCQKSYSA